MDAIDCFGNEGKENEGGGRGGLDLFGRGENTDSATKPENPDLGEEANMDIFVHVPLGVKRIPRRNSNPKFPSCHGPPRAVGCGQTPNPPHNRGSCGELGV